MAYQEYDIRLGLAIPFQRSINQQRYKLKTASVFSPVSVAQLKRNLRIEHNDQDELLQELLDRAVASSQMATGRQ
jgi:predicted HTH transcriptional regulator